MLRSILLSCLLRWIPSCLQKPSRHLLHPVRAALGMLSNPAINRLSGGGTSVNHSGHLPSNLPTSLHELQRPKLRVAFSFFSGVVSLTIVTWIVLAVQRLALEKIALQSMLCPKLISTLGTLPHWASLANGGQAPSRFSGLKYPAECRRSLSGLTWRPCRHPYSLCLRPFHLFGWSLLLDRCRR